MRAVAWENVRQDLQQACGKRLALVRSKVRHCAPDSVSAIVCDGERPCYGERYRPKDQQGGDENYHDWWRVSVMS